MMECERVWSMQEKKEEIRKIRNKKEKKKKESKESKIGGLTLSPKQQNLS